nr:protein BANP-like [Lytechinus pictus]XP_054748299.1 protein BANP-like [Lytechinus pictus]XP_054748300.1 protein BANP-like [Lytechinus pictus]
MSVRTLRNLRLSAGQKRGNADEDLATSGKPDEPPAKIKKGRKKSGEDLATAHICQMHELTDESTQTEPSNFRSSFSEIEKRSKDARRRFSESIRQRHSTSTMKESMAALKKSLDLHFKTVISKLHACQRSNKRLEKEIEELKRDLGQKRTPRPKKKSQSDRPANYVKGPRPHTVIVTLPDEQLDDQLRTLKAEVQKECDAQNTVEIQADVKQNEMEVLDELTVDQKDENFEVDPKQTHSTDGNFTFITLNSEEDYPNGSWLGDVSSPAMRVRCNINPTEMVHIMNMYKSADKLALKLLDFLFDKETQAVSNLSGTGKHKKKKLDPLLIYGIHCHLVKHCGITNEDWYRIRLNIDSKCRTAFRRKQKGLELYPKQIKKERVCSSNIYTTQAYQQSQSVQHLQQVVNELQTIHVPTEEGLTGITIIQEQPDGSTIETTSTPSLVGHILNPDGGEIQPDQLKEVIAQAGKDSEIHLSNGHTIAISQSGELEIREVQLEVAKE